MKTIRLLIAVSICTFFLTACEDTAELKNYPSETGSSVSASVVSDEETQSSAVTESTELTEIVPVSVKTTQSSPAEEDTALTESVSEAADTNGSTLIGDILPQTETLRFFVQDNSADSVVIYFAETKQTSVGQEVFDSIAAVPFEKADDWSANMMALPVYGFYAYDDANSIIFSAAWSNGFWIAEDGTAYRLDYDFSTVAEGYDWDGYGYYGNGYVSDMPCGYYFCFDENGWIKDNMSKRLPFEPYHAPEDIAIEYISSDDIGIHVIITNNREDDFAFFEHFQLEVLLDGEWYVVPSMNRNWDFTQFEVPAGSAVELIYHTEGYRGLPSGNYRIVATNFYVEFVL